MAACQTAGDAFDPLGPCHDPACADDAWVSAIWASALPDANLPGEDAACTAEKIAACRPGSAVGTICFDAQGQHSTGIFIGSELPCSATQVQAYRAAWDAAPCRWLVPFAEMPDSSILRLLDPAVVPSHVCCDLDRTTCRFRVDCAEYRLYIANVGEAGGNTGGINVTLSVTPASTAAFRANVPYLACDNYACGATGSPSGDTFYLSQDGGTLLLSAQHHNHPAWTQPGPAEVVAGCAASFSACP